MPEYARILGDVVKVARENTGLTQAEVAASIDWDTRTFLNIENYKGNPKLDVLHPMICALRIDARKIFICDNGMPYLYPCSGNGFYI